MAGRLKLLNVFLLFVISVLKSILIFGVRFIEKKLKEETIGFNFAFLIKKF